MCDFEDYNDIVTKCLKHKELRIVGAMTNFGFHLNHNSSGFILNIFIMFLHVLYVRGGVLWKNDTNLI